MARPSKPHVVLARLTSNHQRFAQNLIPTDGSASIEDMKVKARQMGGDALVIQDMYTAPLGTQQMGGTTVQGWVIRWQ